mgnify:CR=1 FL=1
MNDLDIFFNKDIKKFAQSYFNHLSNIFDKINLENIEAFSKQLISCSEKNTNIFFIGNGGSAATASHFANDIAVGTKSKNKPFRAISLTDNQAILSAIGNDYGYEYIFKKQLQVYAKKGDMLVSISASGNSKNLINAVEYCNKNNINTFSLTSFDGGILKKISNYNLHIPTKVGEYGPAEDLHMIIAGLVGSYLIRYVKKEINFS